MLSCCSSRFPNTMLHLTLSYKNRFSEKSKSQMKKLFPSHSTSTIQLLNTKGSGKHGCLTSHIPAICLFQIYFYNLSQTVCKITADRLQQSYLQQGILQCSYILDVRSLVGFCCWWWWCFLGFFNEKGRVSYRRNKNLTWDFFNWGCLWLPQTSWDASTENSIGAALFSSFHSNHIFKETFMDPRSSIALQEEN